MNKDKTRALLMLHGHLLSMDDYAYLYAYYRDGTTLQELEEFEGKTHIQMQRIFSWALRHLCYHAARALSVNMYQIVDWLYDAIEYPSPNMEDHKKYQDREKKLKRG